MRKIFIIWVLILFICGCSNDKKGEISYDVQNKCSSEFKSFTIGENRQIHFVCIDNIEIKNDEGKFISVDEYKNDNDFLEFIEKILPKMTLTDTLRDGGTKIYEDTENNVSDGKLIVVMCNKMLSDGSTNKDIYIGEFDKTTDYCTVE